jgi:amidase
MRGVLFAVSSLAALSISLAAAGPPFETPRSFHLVGAGIPDIQHALDTHFINSKQLVRLYLDRIEAYEGLVNAVITVNPRALVEAHEHDLHRARRRPCGVLCGIPIAVKDNIHTTDMPTTGGALAFEGLVPPYEATLVRRLRAAGAIILAKTVLTELANWVAGAPTPMPANYSAIAGFGFNPYDPRPDPRFADGRPVLSPGGSSSGIGTAATFWPANIGTETSGSILSPSNQNMLAAVKPSIGRISRWGVIPIASEQDTAGPMAVDVASAAILLGVLEGADPADTAVPAWCAPVGDYTRHLNPAGLVGARIGIPRAFYYEPVVPPGATTPTGGLPADQAALMATAIDLLTDAGATIVDPANLPSILATNPDDNLLRWGICAGANQAKGMDAGCSVVLKFGFKRDFNAWLASLGPASPIDTLTELREFNLANAARGAIRYGQSRLDISDEMDPGDPVDVARHEADRAKDLRLTATRGIDAAMAGPDGTPGTADDLDALLFPAVRGADVAARPGHPTVIVPFGFVANPATGLPAGFDPKPMPFGVSFTGLRCSEARLIELAYAFEQASRAARFGRVPPASTPPLRRDTRGYR